MRASRIAVWLAMSLMAGLSGCYARYAGPAPGIPGWGGCYGACGGPYANCGLYGEGYGYHGDYLGAGEPPYDYAAYRGVTRERVRLRERLRIRDDERRRSRRPRGRPRDHRRSGRYGDLPYDPYMDGGLGGEPCPCGLTDFGDCGCHSCECGSCGGFDAGPYADYPMPMATGGGPCGPCMECGPSWQDPGCCETCEPPMVYDGMSPGWQSPIPGDAYPPDTCADGSCGMADPDWPMSVPYSHEAFPSESMPQPYPENIRGRGQREPLLAPPSQMPPDLPPEGQFEEPNRSGVSTQPHREPYFAPPSQLPPDSQFDTTYRDGFGKRPQRMSPVRHARLVPSAF